MARTVKTAAQRAHEKDNNARRVAANKKRRADKAAGKAAFKANMKKMAEMGKTIRAARLAAHKERNAAASAEANARRAA